MAHKEGEYIVKDRPTEEEKLRLQHLAAGLNPYTQQQIKQLGISEGWKCLEIGAAEGSMAVWMAEQVGSQGEVMAIDIDAQILNEINIPNLSVAQLDIRSDELPIGKFDFVYCRTLLLHLPDHLSALRKMRDALIPGGILFVEEPDITLLEAADIEHPAADMFAKFHRTLFAEIRRSKIFDTTLGRSLPKNFKDLGLRAVGHKATAKILQGGDPSAQNMYISVKEFMAPPLIEANILSANDLERVLELYQDPDFEIFSGVQVAVWGEKTLE